MRFFLANLKSGLYFFVILLFYVSFSVSANEGLESRSNNKTYVHVKTGAAVTFSHNYDGFSELNQSSNVTLTFREEYDFGDLTITFATTDGLTIKSTKQSYIFTMLNTDTHDINLRLCPTTEGKHYLTIFVSVNNTRKSPLSRVFALAVKVVENNSSRLSDVPKKFGVESDFVRVPVYESTK